MKIHDKSNKMDAPTCRTCRAILDKKSRRTIFSSTFEFTQQLCEVLGSIPSPNDGSYVCSQCYSKLRKLYKIDYDLLHKMEDLRKEKGEVIKSFRQNLTLGNVSATATMIELSLRNEDTLTPIENVISDDSNLESKRSRQGVGLSPTPRKIKKSKPVSAKTPDKPKRKPCIKLFTPSKIKVLFNTGKQIKSRLVKDAELKRVVKAISNGQPKRKIAMIAYNSFLKEEFISCVISDIKKDITKLVSKKANCCLRSTKCDNLSNFKFDRLLFEIQLHAPILYKTLSHSLKDSHVGIAVTTAIITRNKNMHMSALHHIVAQILDHSGTTDECISLFQKMGLSVSSSAATKKKADLAEYQTEHINSTVINEKKALETLARVSAILQVDFCWGSRYFKSAAKCCSQNRCPWWR
ncbi:uncharacterized protein LOC130054274 [Ostrea edulis]|uniref:uncharacterized protein LOC130054274 n=2 Tax=Ostrea edulis TaxID=37623 RepID=UPI0024AFBF4A|nr:uncharacterized protein LOC130054274 [Ostrea edulis]